MYKVYFLDGYEIENVESVEFNHQRSIMVHDGLGKGKFPISDTPDLKSWTIQTEQADTGLFDLIENMLKTKEPSRLIITSDSENISEQVYVESYSKTETYSGTYDVTVKFVEYVEAFVKTTDVPYVARPGKIPTPPKTVVISESESAYQVAKKYSGSVSHGTAYEKLSKSKMEKLYDTQFQDKETGKAVNPCLLEKNKEYNFLESSIIGSVSAYFGAVEQSGGKIFVTKEAMNKAYSQWEADQKKKKK